jgi:hypothetical protein
MDRTPKPQPPDPHPTPPPQMHEHNVVHRDLTSYNILLDFGRPWQVKVRGGRASLLYSTSSMPPGNASI